MRHSAPTATGAVLLVALAVAAPSAQAARTRAAAPNPQPGVTTLYLLEDDADHVQTFPGSPGPWTAGRTVAYWGRFTDKSPAQSSRPVIGSYRATCMWLAQPYWPNSPKHKQDKRLSCTVVIAFKAGPVPPDAPRAELDGFVLQGLMRRPRNDGELFATRYLRDVAIAGGTGKYKGAQGYADIKTAWKIVIHYGLPPG
jgi:hypothetical protein